MRARVVVQLLEVGAVEALRAARSRTEHSLAAEFLVDFRRFRALINVTVDGS